MDNHTAFSSGPPISVCYLRRCMTIIRLTGYERDMTNAAACSRASPTNLHSLHARGTADLAFLAGPPEDVDAAFHAVRIDNGKRFESNSYSFDQTGSHSLPLRWVSFPH
eukprot:scaffold301_cov142-Isochrysis_galbana.AAC.2